MFVGFADSLSQETFWNEGSKTDETKFVEVDF